MHLKPAPYTLTPHPTLHPAPYCPCACLLAGDVEKVEAQRRCPLWGLRLGCYLGAGALQGVLGQGGGQSHLRLSLHSAQRSPERATRFL